jgi:hypothetical protein
MRKTKSKKIKYKKNKTIKKVYKKKDYFSGDGMLTAVWGPSMWHYLHTMSFNYPVEPSTKDKHNYRDFVLSLKHVLPCKYCRENLKNNFKAHPLEMCHMKNRETFSRYIYKLHEVVNKMLGKKSGLKYCDVRERYEHFRARCTTEKAKIFAFSKKEKGCTEPLYGKKAKCILKIVPQTQKCKTLEIDKKCIKRRINK